MKLNKSAPAQKPVTHEGGDAARQSAWVELQRAVSTCLLWEDTFYEGGGSIAQRIADLCAKVDHERIANLAIRARADLKLRHVPLFLARQLARLHRGDSLVSRTLAEVIQRPDELAEFLSIYWKEKKEPLSAQVKKGLAAAFAKFTEYQFSKWDREGAIRLRDVMFLAHPKPDITRDDLFKRIANRELEAADTWEVALSSGEDKKETWERLLRDKKLGYMALLQNLRNMTEAGVDRSLVTLALIDGAPRSKALPFRFVAAAKFAPGYADVLSDAMVRAIEGAQKLSGRTLLVVDVSGSMDGVLSARSKLTRLEAAGALAVLLREICEEVRVYTFSTQLVEIPNLRGIGLMGAIMASQPHSSTYLAAALAALRKQDLLSPDRIIIVTDEQTHDGIIPCWAERGYIVNVAPYEPGLATGGGWTRINGWSERVVDWMRAEESAVWELGAATAEAAG